MDAHAGSPPHHILGYTIRSHTRIYVSYLLPACLELVCFIVQIVADTAVSYQHFRSHQPDFGWATLSLILIPPALTFVLVLSSRDQWANPRYAKRWHFVTHQVFFLILFPFVAIYRLARRVFWSIEALFHDDDDAERMLCLSKAEECSTCELYHLIQAYGQSGPQIILQLYHMLSEDLFRNFETTNVQAISLFFSAIDVAAITTTYQRFESQKLVGRHYPWSSPQQVDAQLEKLAADKRFREESEKRKRESERKIVSFPETDKIMANFKQQNRAEKRTIEETTMLPHHQSDRHKNETQNTNLRLNIRKSMREEQQQLLNLDTIEILDQVPETPAPTLPPVEMRVTQTYSSTLGAGKPDTATAPTEGSSSQHRVKRTSNALSQLDIFKDMLIVNAQLYIKEHMPRPPKMLLTRVEDSDTERQRLVETPSQPQSQSPAPAHTSVAFPKDDVVDFIAPRSTKVVIGLQQDDFAAKVVAFFGWIAFVTMRLLALSTFCVFFPKTFLIILGVHYSLMLAALFLEARFNAKLNRTLFCMVLAYVFIFVLLEFRVKFKRVHLWFIGYFLLTMTENISMTITWYTDEEFESWWFDFIFEGIIYSGILFIATLLVYYIILKPKEVALVMEDDGKAKDTTT